VSAEGTTLQFESVFIPKRTRATKAHTALPPLHVPRFPGGQSWMFCPVSVMQQYEAMHGQSTPQSPLWVHPKSGVAATPHH
jgi:hypothetical protein